MSSQQICFGDDLFKGKLNKKNRKDIPRPVNTSLYQRVKSKSNKKFKKSSLIRSKWIVNEYIKEGGTYRGKRKSSLLSKGFKKWNSKK